jgi:hypothetical protein
MDSPNFSSKSPKIDRAQFIISAKLSSFLESLNLDNKEINPISLFSKAETTESLEKIQCK